MRHQLTAPKAFTLIELLVVVAIIALLISILLPSLSEAREQGKVAKCLSNIRNLMTTTHIYFLEDNDRFPVIVTATGGNLGICNFTYAGKTNGVKNNKETIYTSYWKSYLGGLFFSRTQDRPFNRISIGRKPGVDDEMEQYRCPNDNSSFQYKWPNNTQNLSAYTDVGTSYLYNLYAISDTNIDPWKPWPPRPGVDVGWVKLGQACVRDGRGGFSGRFALYYEERVDGCLETGTRNVGHHRKFGRHTLGFLDGHAAHISMKTTDWCGPGWTLINPNWVKSDLNKNPEIYYTKSGKNCDPKK